MSHTCSFSLLLIEVLWLTANATAGEYAGRGGWGAKDSVFRVQCVVSTPAGRREVELGTGFGHKSGNVLSANHVVEPCLNAKGSLQLAAVSKTVSKATVISRDASLDLALLKPDDGFIRNPLPIATRDTMTIGSQVSSWGFPTGYQGDIALLTVGYLAGVSSDPTNLSIRRWVVNAAINKGNSGGPLLETETPAIIGVVIQKFSPLTNEVKSELERLSKSGSPEGKTLAHAMIDIAERAQLVIAQSVMTNDLQKFLRRAGVEP
jgi:S1-C subfamily serine protease